MARQPTSLDAIEPRSHHLDADTRFVRVSFPRFDGAVDLLKEAVPPKARYAAIQTLAAEGFSVDLCCRVLEVSVSGYYAWRSRPLSARSLRHAWLTKRIRAVHMASRGTYGAARVHAELRLGHGIIVGHNAVEMLMRRAGIKGLPTHRYRRPLHNTATASDLVNRQFNRGGPDLLWVADITEHPTRDGKVYCAVVLDSFSRRFAGWSIDASQTSALVTNALSMAISNRQPDATVIHSDHGAVHLERLRQGVQGRRDPAVDERRR